MHIQKTQISPNTLAGQASVHPLSSNNCSEPRGGGGSLRKGRGPSPTLGYEKLEKKIMGGGE